MTELDGPRLDPEQGPATALVVFLHGYGSDGNDLIGIGESWAPFLPGVAFASPNAPQVCGMGYQWFPLTMRDDEERWSGVQAAQPALDAFLDAELVRTSVAASRLVLVGFSQGTMMALHVGLRRAVAPASIIGYSGYLAGADQLDETTVKPPVLLIHGTADEVLPVESSKTAAAALAAANVPVSLHLSPGLGHGIDRMGLVLGLRATAVALGIDLPD
jgi:phospholipase/carboxylesterase